MSHIIPRIQPTGQPAWQTSLAQAIRDPQVLLQQLKLPATLLAAARQAATQFPLRVPQGFVQRMHPGDANDPLLLQVLPLHLELQSPPGYGTDPVGDHHAEQRAGVLQKYQGRTLLITTGACAVHCRYCFRRHYPYAESNAARDGWDDTVSLLRQQTDLQEVILSGGDPLTLTESRLQALTDQLNRLEHIRYVRIHSRLPVVLPERVNEALLTWLDSIHAKVVMVIHSNHAQELNHEVATACRALKGAGVELLNQSVLLKGINDNTDSLCQLSTTLFDLGVLPYYLHQLDRVAGAAHFEVDDQHALQLIEQLRQRLPGYLVPRLVREVSGQPYKQPLFDLT
ncbi:MAG: EF-P beta-lysylation protein EpmB [Gammaproteobacteria bacterium]|nr:EF-P beta-lysylation protein EpmB [Gammaproteobacteria bacterium]